MKTITLLFCCNLFVVAAAICQEQKDKPTRKISLVAYTSGGIRYLDRIGELNNALAGANAALPKFDNFLNVAEGGVGVVTKRWYFLFLDRSYFVSGSSSYPQVIGSGKGNELRIHWKLIEVNRLKLYPYVGIGGQELNYFLDISTQPLSTILTATTLSKQSLKLSSNQSTLNSGIFFDWKVKSFNKNLDLNLGGGIGYTFLNQTRDFRVNDQLTDYKSGSFGGMDIRLAIAVLYHLSY